MKNRPVKIIAFMFASAFISLVALAGHKPAEAAFPQGPTDVSDAPEEEVRACYCASCIEGPGCTTYKAPSCDKGELASWCVAGWIAISCPNGTYPCNNGNGLRCCS
ncbi:hypothetical protein [Sorangium sp. So ce1335]|uniref:hypothetical protein n=1 Tax=Sorangium sp. So ce1335 TaxID=3133335 RepID=UPI003F60BB9E